MKYSFHYCVSNGDCISTAPSSNFQWSKWFPSLHSLCSHIVGNNHKLKQKPVRKNSTHTHSIPYEHPENRYDMLYMRYILAHMWCHTRNHPQIHPDIFRVLVFLLVTERDSWCAGFVYKNKKTILITNISPAFRLQKISSSHSNEVVHIDGIFPETNIFTARKKSFNLWDICSSLWTVLVEGHRELS